MRKFLSVGFIEAGLVVPGVDVAGAAIHEQPDHSFGPGRKMRGARRHRVGLELGVERQPLRAEDGIEREQAETATGQSQEIASGVGYFDSSAVAHGTSAFSQSLDVNKFVSAHESGAKVAESFTEIPVARL